LVSPVASMSFHLILSTWRLVFAGSVSTPWSLVTVTSIPLASGLLPPTLYHFPCSASRLYCGCGSSFSSSEEQLPTIKAKVNKYMIFVVVFIEIMISDVSVVIKIGIHMVVILGCFKC